MERCSFKPFPRSDIFWVGVELVEEASRDGWITDCSRNSLTLQSRVSTRAGMCLTASAQLSRESCSPGASPGASSCRLLLWQHKAHSGASSWALAQCFAERQCCSEMETLQCSAIHVKNLWVKQSLKEGKQTPFLFWEGYNSIPRPVETTPNLHFIKP